MSEGGSPIIAVLANLSVSDLGVSIDWYQHLIGRAPDTAPMDGLVEWRFGGGAGLQIYRNPGLAGQGCVTLVVSDVWASAARLGLGEPAKGDTARLLQLRDPDDNLVVLAQPL